MLHRLYNTFLKPVSQDPDLRSRELVLNYLLFGSLCLILAAQIGTFISFLLLRYDNFSTSGPAMLFLLILVGALYYAARVKHWYRAVSWMLVGLLLLAGAYSIISWGLFLPVAGLLFGFVIIMSGILLGARYSLYTTVMIVLLLLILEYARVEGITHPDTSWLRLSSNLGDVFGFFLIYGAMAFVSWLFNRQMEQSLKRARRSETALREQKDLLEVKVEERTRELEAAQLEKIQQVYRFAELGRVSSALFHDLANHLTNVSLDIEGLEPEGRSKIMRRIQHDIHYIDDVVQRVRYQLRGQTTIEEFNVGKEIDQVAKILMYKCSKARVKLKITKKSSGPVLVTGDVTRFRQLVMNLLSNAIEAYPPLTAQGGTGRTVLLEFEQKNDTLTIRVTDWGVGIASSKKSKVFEPFYSEKAEGTGIGLFIVQQIVEQDLKGTISLRSSAKAGTTFTLRLPLAP